jgi:hypothetical protein
VRLASPEAAVACSWALVTEATWRSLPRATSSTAFETSSAASPADCALAAICSEADESEWAWLEICEMRVRSDSVICRSARENRRRSERGSTSTFRSPSAIRSAIPAVCCR